MQNTIDNFTNALTYKEYRQLIADLLAENQSTGHVQSEALTQYSKLNDTRMHRLDKTVVVPENIGLLLKGLRQNYTWLVISEGWCGDAAQILPVLHKLAGLTEKIDLEIVLRDDHAALMDQFLTNGTRSIPKLIVLDSQRNVLADWGPRPKTAQQLVTDYKTANAVFDEAGKTNLQLWYTHDKGKAVMDEVVGLMLPLEERVTNTQVEG